MTQDHSILDPFDFDAAGRGIAEIQSVRESWMADDNAIAAEAENRADAAQRQEMIQAAPAAAAMMKARQATGPGTRQAVAVFHLRRAQAPAAAGTPLTAV